MSVTVDYFGRLGNNLFQWVSARMIADGRGLKVVTPPPETFLHIKPASDGAVLTGEPYIYTDEQAKAGEVPPTDRPIHMHGFFQDAKYYYGSRDYIRNCFDLPMYREYHDDIVVHLRLTDYWWVRNKSVISPMWYQKILAKEKYDKCIVVVEDHPSNNRYLNNFKSLVKNVRIVSGTPESDFYELMKYSRVICSNSTFAWWAAFLSTAEKIWTFKPWMYNKGIPLAEMDGATVVDGDFIRDRQFEQMDWTDYWRKKWPLPRTL